MPSFEQGRIVRVPFPYTDRDTRQRRPALVISDGPVGAEGALLWVAMITSAEKRRWTDDVPIADHAAAGLPAPSMIRVAKIATIERRIAEPIGALAPAELEAVRLRMKTLLGPLSA